MKNILLCCFVLLTFTTNGFSQILPRINKLRSIVCTLNPIPSKHGDHPVPNIPATKEVATPLTGPATALSLNWAGYAIATQLQSPENRAVGSVSGAWFVPKVKSSPTDAFSVAFVGMDGIFSPTVEQIGTEHDWMGGAAHYFAWFELFPTGAFQIVGFPVKPGDLVGATVAFIGHNTFQMSIQNFTRGVIFQVPFSFTKLSGALRNSAEWIVEAPSNTSGILPLANVGTVKWTHCVATVEGDTGSISDDDWQDVKITMVSPSNVVKAKPTSLTDDGTDFNVVWQSN